MTKIKNVFLYILFLFFLGLVLYQSVYPLKEGLDDTTTTSTSTSSGTDTSTDSSYQSYPQDSSILEKQNSGNIDFLKGRVDTLSSDQSQMKNQLDDMSKTVSDLSDKVSALSQQQQGLADSVSNTQPTEITGLQ
jgi:hypothetical protein